jgi:hypothetical protein
MSQRAAKIIAIILFSLVILVAAKGVSTMQSVQAQEKQNNTMRELLESLNSRIENESEFVVSIKFFQPLRDNNEFRWEIPYYSESLDTSRVFGEIGDNFVCFNETAGSSYVTLCTPYSNIISINYGNDF